MKKLLFFAVILLLMTGCLSEGKSEYTPSISCRSIVTTAGDTLRLSAPDDVDYYLLDTMQVGDTAQLIFLFISYENDLVSTRIKADNKYAKLEMQLTDEIRNAMLETSDTLNGIINFKPGYGAVQFLSNYIALEEGTPSLYVGVHSDSKYSPTNFEIRTPIRK